ncbi:MAG: hypothetical protein HOI25_02350, partial [Proteobacteria bacterium]|nr:hypothetical protein [Pseudomonadota bacterium]
PQVSRDALGFIREERFIRAGMRILLFPHNVFILHDSGIGPRLKSAMAARPGTGRNAEVSIFRDKGDIDLTLRHRRTSYEKGAKARKNSNDGSEHEPLQFGMRQVTSPDCTPATIQWE